MRRTIFLGSFFACLCVMGCSNFQGPLQARKKPKADAPGYTIEQQQQRGRDRYSIPEDDFRIGPPTGISRPDQLGRY